MKNDFPSKIIRSSPPKVFCKTTPVQDEQFLVIYKVMVLHSFDMLHLMGDKI